MDSDTKTSIGAWWVLKPDCADPNDVTCLQDNPYELCHLNVKANVQVSPNNKLNFLFSRNEKSCPIEVRVSTSPTFETTQRQSGPGYLYKLEDTHIVSSNLLITGRFAFFDTGFDLKYQAPGLRNVQASYELTTGIFDRSAWSFETEQPNIIANFDGNYFLPGRAGGDHEMQFGLQYRHYGVKTRRDYGGDVSSVFRAGEAAGGWFYRPGNLAYEMTTLGVYVQDIFTWGRWNLKREPASTPRPARTILHKYRPTR